MQSMAAGAALVAALCFVAVLLLLHLVRADLAPSWHMISEYGVGPRGWIMSLAFYALATAFVMLALTFAVDARGPLGFAAVGLLLLAGVGAAIGGTFPVDPPGTLPANFSRAGQLHGLGFMIGVPGTLFGVTCLTIYLLRQPAWREARAMLLATAGAVWLTMIIFGVSMARLMRAGATGEAFVIGWQNRALVLAWAAYVVAVAWRVVRSARTA